MTTDSTEQELKSSVKAPRRKRANQKVASTKKTSRAAWRQRTIFRHKFLYFLILPGLIYFFVFKYLPLAGLIIAFKDYHGLGGVKGIFTSPWVGFRYFEYLFTSHYFWRLLRNTLLISTYRLIFGFPAPIILALLINELQFMKFKRIVQTISYLPHFVSWVVVAGLVTMILSPSTGPVNALIKELGFEPISFLVDKRYFRGVLVVSSIWREIGWGSIIYLAAISSVPQEQYESAYLEGANRVQRAWYITIPGISLVIAILLILAIGRIIEENFEQIFNLYNPAVYEVADVFETYIYRRGLIQADFSYGTAVGFFKSFTSLVLVAATNRAAKMLGQEGLW